MKPDRDRPPGRQLGREGADAGGERAFDSFGRPGQADQDEADLLLLAEAQDLGRGPGVVGSEQRAPGSRQSSRGVRRGQTDPLLPEIDRQDAHGKRVAERLEAGVRCAVCGVRENREQHSANRTPNTENRPCAWREGPRHRRG